MKYCETGDINYWTNTIQKANMRRLSIREHWHDKPQEQQDPNVRPEMFKKEKNKKPYMQKPIIGLRHACSVFLTSVVH